MPIQKLKRALTRAACGAMIGLSVTTAWAADAAQDPEKLQFRNDMQAKKVPIDHVAKIGRYDYEIYVRKGENTQASAVISEESYEALMTLRDKKQNKVMAEQYTLVAEYLSRITGRPPQPYPKSQGMGHLGPGPDIERARRDFGLQGGAVELTAPL